MQNRYYTQRNSISSVVGSMVLSFASQHPVIVGAGVACLLVSGIFLYFGNAAAAKEAARLEEKLAEAERQLFATQKHLAEIETLVKELHSEYATIPSPIEPVSLTEIVSPFGFISMPLFLFFILAYLWFSCTTPEMRDTYLLRLRQHGDLIRTSIKENIILYRQYYFSIFLFIAPLLTNLDGAIPCTFSQHAQLVAIDLQTTLTVLSIGGLVWDYGPRIYNYLTGNQPDIGNIDQRLVERDKQIQALQTRLTVLEENQKRLEVKMDKMQEMLWEMRAEQRAAANHKLPDPIEQFQMQEVTSLLPGFTNMSLFLSLVLTIAYLWFGCTTAEMRGAYLFILRQCYFLIRTSIKENIMLYRQYYFSVFFFLFIVLLLTNLGGVIPYTFTVTSSFAFSFLLALGHFLGLNLIATVFLRWGVFGFFLPGNSALAIVPLLVPVEIVSYIARTFSLSIRLFANMMSGHALLKILSGFSWKGLKNGPVAAFLALLPWIVVTVIYGLETVIATLQAYVFVTLLLMYVNDTLVTH